METKQEPYFEIEKMADLAEARRKQGNTNIVFDNDGKMIVDNRARRRARRQVWRAKNEKRHSIHFYTKKHNTTNRKTKKAERQNRKKGRH